jgi:ABC-type dipeptide/oligopeptide/nickel transport system permease subunit
MLKVLRLLGVAAIISLSPLNAFASAQGNAAIMIIAACTWAKMGRIPRSNIMSFAKKQYEAKFGGANSIDWSNAITVAEKLDKKEGLGCFR